MYIVKLITENLLQVSVSVCVIKLIERYLQWWAALILIDRPDKKQKVNEKKPDNLDAKKYLYTNLGMLFKDGLSCTIV